MRKIRGDPPPRARQKAPVTTRRVAAPPVPAPTPVVVDEAAAKKMVEAGAHASSAFQQQGKSSLVAVRLLHGAVENARADAGVAVLSVELRDPRTGKPPTVDQVADSMLALLTKQIPRVDDGTLQQLANAPAEGYYVVTYDDRSGALSLRQVAAGDEHSVTVRADDVAAAVPTGEKLLGGLHNHPGKQRARASREDAAATALLEQRFQGYVDFVVAGGAGKVSATQVRGSDVVSDGDSATFHVWHANKMNRDPEKPRSIERVDTAHVDVPGAQIHIHFTRMCDTRNEDGTWGHGGGDDSLLMSKEAKWIQKWDDAK